MPVDLVVAIKTLDVLVPIAKAVPVLGPSVEGALEATKKILEHAQVCDIDPLICAYRFSCVHRVFVATKRP